MNILSVNIKNHTARVYLEGVVEIYWSCPTQWEFYVFCFSYLSWLLFQAKVQK
jgi:hypothetical protein